MQHAGWVGFTFVFLFVLNMNASECQPVVPTDAIAVQVEFTDDQFVLDSKTLGLDEFAQAIMAQSNPQLKVQFTVAETSDLKAYTLLKLAKMLGERGYHVELLMEAEKKTSPLEPDVDSPREFTTRINAMQHFRLGNSWLSVEEFFHQVDTIIASPVTLMTSDDSLLDEFTMLKVIRMLEARGVSVLVHPQSKYAHLDAVCAR